MKGKDAVKLPFTRLVLFMICLSVAGGGIVAAQGDFSDSLVPGNPHVLQGGTRVRCENMKEVCRGVAWGPRGDCNNECTVRHMR